MGEGSWAEDDATLLHAEVGRLSATARVEAAASKTDASQRGQGNRVSGWKEGTTFTELSSRCCSRMGEKVMR